MSAKVLCKVKWVDCNPWSDHQDTTQGNRLKTTEEYGTLKNVQVTHRNQARDTWGQNPALSCWLRP